MTEFGKSQLIPAQALEDIGYNAVIYPVTTLRLAMGAIEAGLREIHDTGTQEGLLGRMQTRSRLYELLEYERYNEFDSGVFDFTLTDMDLSSIDALDTGVRGGPDPAEITRHSFGGIDIPEA